MGVGMGGEGTRPEGGETVGGCSVDGERRAVVRR